MGGFSERLIDQMNDKEAIIRQQEYIESLERRLHVARVAMLTDASTMDGMEALIDLLMKQIVEVEKELKNQR